MAKLTIEWDQNEFELWDWWAYVNGELIESGENHTSENGAYNEASLALKGWVYRD